MTNRNTISGIGQTLKEKVDNHFLMLQVHSVSFVQAVPVVVHSSGAPILVIIVEVDDKEEVEVGNLTELERLEVMLGEVCKKVVEQLKVKDTKGKGK